MLLNSIFKYQYFWYFPTFAIFTQLFKRLIAWRIVACPPERGSVAAALMKEVFAQADFKLRRVATVVSPNKERHLGFCLSKVILEIFQPSRRALYLSWLSLSEDVKPVCANVSNTLARTSGV